MYFEKYLFQMQIDRREGIDRHLRLLVHSPDSCTGWSQEPGALPWSPLSVAGAQAPRVARTRTCALTWDAGVTGGGSTCGATAPASESFHVQVVELTGQKQVQL